MQTRIHRGLLGLESLSGPVVIFDVFRASNTIISLLAAGAERVGLLADLAEARALKEERKDWLFWGERKGLTVEGFDGGNSPMAASRLDLAGRTVVLTTSAGTQAVYRLTRARAVFFGSFANAPALAQALASPDYQEATLLPMGLEAKEPAAEDDLAAEYLRDLMVGQAPEFGPIREKLLACPGADRLRRLGQEDDLEFCTKVGSHELIPRVEYGKIPWARLDEPL